MILLGHRVIVAGRPWPCAGLLPLQRGGQIGDIVLTGQSHRSDKRITALPCGFCHSMC
jgi:hypothetical protein